MAAAVAWPSKEHEESITIYRRPAFHGIWKHVNQTDLDAEDLEFSKAGNWKEKEVRNWLLKNCWPTINYRMMDGKGVMPFPFSKYFGHSNSGGVGLIVVDWKTKTSETGDVDDITTGLSDELQMRSYQIQLRTTKFIRPHAARLFDKFKFAVVEKHGEQAAFVRDIFKMGLDPRVRHELILIENAGVKHWDGKDQNFFHGNPQKYRLTNLTQAGINQFFEDYEAKKLKTYWASSAKPNPTRSESASKELLSDTFEEHLLADSKKGALVAFFNDDPEGRCGRCPELRPKWEEIAKKLAKDKALRTKVDMFDIDQSANEHPEDRMPALIDQPGIMWYPPGSKQRRGKGRKMLSNFWTSWAKGEALDVISELADDEQDEL
eukprot:TRINITY_DN20222_c1_g2_i1.p1 TRINITY_DN20222_c1_g2~~TRINITY_DN20222_c1_g2_i1.p1  ORF type:complete len:427 (-),score=75.81 TRINITY_DN20222_c1_g2_i1:125-1255(-)